MIQIENADKGRTYKACHVRGAQDETEALNAAMRHFGETQGSLFGWRVSLVGEVFAVTLFTD